MRIWINPVNTAQLFRDPNDPRRRQRICNDLDERGFGWLVCFVAGSGFFTDSYNLFATNVILPCLAYVYWQTETNGHYETYINLATLIGSLIGQLVFGFLADKYGRRKLYGLELVFVIFGTLGLAESSAGYGGSMSVLGWLIFWRFFVGIGIGAEYPLSAVITAEFAPVQSRARMMSTVFSMQALGQLVAALVGLAVVMTIGFNSVNQKEMTVDIIWRIVVGVGAFPALVAIFFRLLIPESPRFTLDVCGNSKQALIDTQTYLEEPLVLDFEQEMAENDAFQLPPAALPDINEDEDERYTPPATGKTEFKQFSKQDLHQFFITEGNWRYLAGTSLSWFLLDFAYYGLGINSPRTIASLWATAPANGTNFPEWSDPWAPGGDIYTVLYNDYTRYIITVSTGSLLGSLFLIKIIDYVPRKSMLAWSFLSLFILFIVTGASFLKAFETDLHALTITLYVLSQLLFNLGPNSLTFIIPAEIFPTRYRATCHGIAAASGKLGSVIVQALFLNGSISSVGVNNGKSLAWILIGFGFLMALGAVFTWAWIPDVQWPQQHRASHGLHDARHDDEGVTRHAHKMPSRTLEDLARGRAAETEPECIVGLRHKLGLLWRRIANRR